MRRAVTKFVFAVMLLPACVLAQAAEWTESAQLSQLFKREGVNATFIVHDLAADTYTVHDRQRAQKRYVPASTFKIANSLIGLSAGVVDNVDQVLPYGGGPTRRPEWARDMSLRDGLWRAFSAVTKASRTSSIICVSIPCSRDSWPGFLGRCGSCGPVPRVLGIR